MKRGEIYWSYHKDSLGRERRKPVLVISNDVYNSTTPYVSSIWLSLVDRNPGETHINVPADAFENIGGVMGDCVALCETMSSVKQANLIGPIAVLKSNYWMSEIMHGIKVQLGIEKMRNPTQFVPSVQTDAPQTESYMNTTTNTKYWEQPYYTAYGSPQYRATNPSSEGA